MEGEKKIVTQWIRYGVDDERHADSLGVSLFLFVCCGYGRTSITFKGC
jgi:hypothetical protein